MKKVSYERPMAEVYCLELGKLLSEMSFHQAEFEGGLVEQDEWGVNR